MTLEEFRASLAKSDPPQNSPPLRGLWFDAKESWDKAHKAVQDDPGPAAAWVHAYLHRKEGDDSNASYWYSRAGKTFPTLSLEEEWEEIAGVLLSHS